MSTLNDPAVTLFFTPHVTNSNAFSPRPLTVGEAPEALNSLMLILGI